MRRLQHREIDTQGHKLVRDVPGIQTQCWNLELGFLTMQLLALCFSDSSVFVRDPQMKLMDYMTKDKFVHDLNLLY